MLCLGCQGLLGTAHIFPKCIRPGMQPGFCSSLLQAEARQEAVLVFYSVFSSLESACLYRGHGFFLFLVLKNPSCCHLVPLLQLVGSFLLVCRHMCGSCHRYVLEEISLSPSLFLPSFLCFDCDSVYGKCNGLMWNNLRYRAWCEAKLGVKFWDGKEMEDGGASLFSVDRSWQQVGFQAGGMQDVISILKSSPCERRQAEGCRCRRTLGRQWGIDPGQLFLHFPIKPS